MCIVQCCLDDTGGCVKIHVYIVYKSVHVCLLSCNSDSRAGYVTLTELAVSVFVVILEEKSRARRQKSGRSGDF